MKKPNKKQLNRGEQETEFANIEMDRKFYGTDATEHFRSDVYHISNTAPMIEADQNDSTK